MARTYEERRAYFQEYYRKRKKLFHLKYKAGRRKKLSNKTCLTCHAYIKPGCKFCKACLVTKKEKRESLKSLGLCTQCGMHPPTSGLKCDACKMVCAEGLKRL